MNAASHSNYERWFLAFAMAFAEAETGPTVYAACTSEAVDLQSQWDSFADNGRGFAIGLNRDVLYRAAAGQGYSLNRLIYDVVEQESLYEIAIRETLAELPGLEQSMGRGPGLTLLLAIALSFPLTFVKNGEYVSEAEWRLMRLETHLEEAPEPQIRGSGTRYEEVTLCDVTGESSISEVIAGSKASLDSINRARRLLDQCGLSRVPLTQSQMST
jgi:hypothetical protein